jgi:hypothetical protein
MPTIFVQIASYRDPELLATLKNALLQAKYPDRLFFGICNQVAVSEDSIPSLKNCRILEVQSSDSKGMSWARVMAQGLWDKEDYCLQIDSHMRFTQDWDKLLIEMLQQCESQKPAISAYLPNYSPPDKIEASLPCRIGALEFYQSTGILRLKAGASCYTDKPVLGSFTCGHFIFAPHSFFREIPPDPNIYFLGEEISIAVRAWTRGWDIYHPSRVVCYHKYSRDGRVKHWEEHKYWSAVDSFSMQRCRELFGIERITRDFGVFGLGNERSLKEYEAFSGIDFKNQVISDAANPDFSQASKN